jgi:hypothetical protein
MSEPIVYIDRSEIREGKLEELKAAIDELVRFVEANEPQLISYAFYLNEAATRMTVIAIHPDSASLALHMSVAGPLFRRFRDFIRMSAIEIHGPLDEALLDQLRQKAGMLGSGTVLSHRRHAGFTRLAGR